MNFGSKKNEQAASEASKTTDLFVHIGDSEIRGTLPVEGRLNAQLYKEVEEKKKLLEELRKRNISLSDQNKEIAEELEQQTDQRNFIKSLKQSKEQQLEQEKHLIRIAEVERAQLMKELSESQQKLKYKQERCKGLSNILQNQTNLFDGLHQKDERNQQLHKNFNKHIAGAEKSCDELTKALESDHKTTIV
ncbi:unnamed protein product [Anisakis simplex]|uniref:CCDC38 n=1 Tax=Anisakis simplex TaxID=6269 RepID=A0A0M3KG33_ANISI|nr:unnamed protein product [Anisakis simplex]